MTKWIVYTLLFGLILVVCEFLVFLLMQGVDYSIYYSIEDLLGYALLLNISNINELEHIDKKKLEHIDDKTKGNGLSIAGIIFATLFFFIHTIDQAHRISNGDIGLFTKKGILVATFCTVAYSLVISWRIIRKINKKRR